MNVLSICERMQANMSVITGLYTGLAEDQLHWRPEPEKWSLLEVLCHLHDEEIDDFRTRVEYTLHRPGESWPSIHPEQWVQERKYSEWDFRETLSAWQARRSDSVKWLLGLQGANWDATYEHPQIGSLSAGDLLVSWVTHDHLHLGQITRLQLAYHREAGRPFSSRYAEP